jgi:hypothetical protein
MSWSWSELVTVYGGDEERALHALEGMPGVGRYKDEVHSPSRSRPRIPTPIPTDEPPPPDLTPVDPDHPGGLCMWGHPRVLRNGYHLSGRQKWVCRPCQRQRRKWTRPPRRPYR